MGTTNPNSDKLIKQASEQFSIISESFSRLSNIFEALSKSFINGIANSDSAGVNTGTGGNTSTSVNTAIGNGSVVLSTATPVAANNGENKKKKTIKFHGYNVYCHEKKPELEILYPNLSGLEIHKMCLESWKTVEDKQFYTDKANSINQDLLNNPDKFENLTDHPYFQQHKLKPRKAPTLKPASESLPSISEDADSSNTDSETGLSSTANKKKRPESSVAVSTTLGPSVDTIRVKPEERYDSIIKSFSKAGTGKDTMLSSSYEQILAPSSSQESNNHAASGGDEVTYESSSFKKEHSKKKKKKKNAFYSSQDK